MLHLLPDFREGADRGRGDGMRSQQLLQPDHMVPAGKFAAALGELPHRPEAQMGVEVQTVVGQIVVVLFGDGDTGVQVQDALLPQNGFQRVVQPSAQPLMAAVMGKVDGGLRRPAVGWAGMERPRIGIAHHDAVLHGNQIGVLFQGVPDARRKFLRCGHLVLKGDGGVPDIVSVNIQQRRSILRRCVANGNFRYGGTS